MSLCSLACLCALSAVCMTGSTEALTQTLSEIRRRGASLDSDGLLSLVDANFAGISIEHEQQTIDTLLRAWDRVRDVPDVSVNEIVASTALKRDALKWLDVVYHASMYIDPANAGPLEAQFESGGLRQWWGRWTRGPHRMRRLAATSLLSLLDEGPPESIVALGCDRGGLCSLSH